jgi:hypothetical protein
MTERPRARRIQRQNIAREVQRFASRGKTNEWSSKSSTGNLSPAPLCISCNVEPLRCPAYPIVEGECDCNMPVTAANKAMAAMALIIRIFMRNLLSVETEETLQ